MPPESRAIGGWGQVYSRTLNRPGPTPRKPFSPNDLSKQNVSRTQFYARDPAPAPEPPRNVEHLLWIFFAMAPLTTVPQFPSHQVDRDVSERIAKNEHGVANFYAP